MSATPLRQLGTGPLGEAFPLPFVMAFQPIVDAGSRDVFAYEALVRGVSGEGAGAILSAVTRANRRHFDELSRATALELAVAHGLKDERASVSINFMPNAVSDAAACTRQTLAVCERLDFPADRVIFEFTEGEPVDDEAHLGRIIGAYRQAGFRTAIDDFGAGYSGLTLLANFQPDIVKLDMALIRGIDADPVRRAIVSAIRRMCDDLGIVIVAEGIETGGEYAVLRDLGVSLLQGYLFAKPQIGVLTSPTWPRGR